MGKILLGHANYALVDAPHVQTAIQINAQAVSNLKFYTRINV